MRRRTLKNIALEEGMERKPELIVDYTLTEEDANKTNFIFTVEDYQLLKECKNFNVRVNNKVNKQMPYINTFVDNKKVGGNSAGSFGFASSTIMKKGKNWYYYGSNWINVSLATELFHAASWVSAYPVTIEEDLQNIGIGSHQKFLDVGAEIKIYGW